MSMKPNYVGPLEILYEDPDLWVFNKPAGLVVNEAQTTTEETVQSILKKTLAESAGEIAVENDWQALVPSDFDATYGTPSDIFALRQGMVHRLDKQTSGILVWAKNPGSLVNLLAQFKTRTVDKTYVALVHGKIDAPKATLNYPLGRASRDRKVFAVTADGRPAVTEYQLKQLFNRLKQDKAVELIWPKVALNQTIATHLKTPHQLLKRLEMYQGFSLIECHPLTGRTHQIRVHMAHIRHPLVGDMTYVGRKRQTLDPLWCPRHFLHAATLTFKHPRTGEELTFSAPLSTDLQAVLALLEPA